MNSLWQERPIATQTLSTNFDNAKLPIFHHWDLCPNLLHASLDGQKFITEWDNIIARHSQKYFGFDKGVVTYSLIANHLPINTMIIGANEHENRFFFDLIYNNTSEIQPDIFSTDTEGSNQLNFLLLHLIERLYAPRYRSLGYKSDSIICFSNSIILAVVSKPSITGI